MCKLFKNKEIGDKIHMKKTKRFLIKLLLIILSVYVIYTLINQQKTLALYEKNKEELHAQIEEQTEYKEELTEQKDNINSLEFIEQAAREYLDMYLPNEKVYVDQNR